MRAPSRTHTKTGTKDPRVTPWIHHSPQAVFKGPCSGQLRGAGEGGGSARLTALPYRASFCWHRATDHSKALVRL